MTIDFWSCARLLTFTRHPPSLSNSQENLSTIKLFIPCFYLFPQFEESHKVSLILQTSSLNCIGPSWWLHHYFLYNCKKLFNHFFLYTRSLTLHRNSWKANWIKDWVNRSIIWIVEIVMFVEQYSELTSHICLSAHSIVTHILKTVCHKTSK